MKQVFRLILIVALSFGPVIAPDVSAVNAAEVAMAQMDTAESTDDHCSGCNPTEFAGNTPCENGCPVPCGSGGTAGIVIRTPSARLAMSFDVIVPVAEPLIPLGANPSLDPFPPKLPV